MAPPTHINHAAFRPSRIFSNVFSDVNFPCVILQNVCTYCITIFGSGIDLNSVCMLLDNLYHGGFIFANLCNKFREFFYKVICWCSIFWLGDLETKHHQFHWIRWMFPDLQLCSSYIKSYILRKRKPFTFLRTLHISCTITFLYAKDKTVPFFTFCSQLCIYIYIWPIYRL